MTDVLTGRAAIVTGGSHGLGSEIARAFLAAGARVLVCGRDAAALDRARTELESIAPDPARVAAARADVSEPDAADAIVSTALERFSRVDVLVNNAGVYGPKGCVEDVAWDEWEQAIRVNLFGSVLCARAGASPFPRKRLWEDHPALWGWCHLTAPSPQCLRGVESRGRPVR